MTIDELMNHNRPILDGLADWLTLEAANTDRAYLKDRFQRWIDEVRTIQMVTRRVENQE